MIHEADARAMDDTAEWALANVQRPRAVAPDAEVAARYGALQQSLSHYRAAGDRAEFTLADKIIASAQLESSEIGSLRGEVRRLCDEVAALSNPNVSPAAAKCNEVWGYVDVRAGAAFGHALVRCFYDDDKDGDGDMRAVYLAGFDITSAIDPNVMAELIKAFEAERDVLAEANAIDAAIDRATS